MIRFVVHDHAGTPVPGPADGNIRQEGVGESLREAHEQARHTSPGAFVRVTAIEPSPAELDALTDAFGLDPHQVGNAGNPHQRPKADITTERAFVVLKTLAYGADTAQVESGQLAVLAGPGYVVTVHHGIANDLPLPGDGVDLDASSGAAGPFRALHAIVDEVVAGYLTVTGAVQEEVERLEERVFSPDARDPTSAIYLLKRENLEVRRAVTPLATLAADLAHQIHPGLPTHLRPPFREVGEHLLRVADQAESVDTLLLALMSAANAQAEVKQSADQRRMAAWAAIALVPTVVASIYGMNFATMPELEWRWGYPVVLLLLLTVIVVMYRRFRSAGWL